MGSADRQLTQAPGPNKKVGPESDSPGRVSERVKRSPQHRTVTVVRASSGITTRRLVTLPPVRGLEAADRSPRGLMFHVKHPSGGC